jgi:hypothetical protein
MISMPNDAKLDELVPAVRRLLKVSARLYMHMTRATLDRFGKQGEMTVRYGLRAYGEWRGIEMREAHHAMGLEVNMKNLIACWDSASVFVIQDEMHDEKNHKPYDTIFDVRYCPASEAWKEADFHQWGHVYCDELHQALASTYHPDGNVVIPQNLMKGDDHCHFRWIMPPDAQKLELGEPTLRGRKLSQYYQAHTEVEGAWQALVRTDRLLGGRFYVIAKVLLDRHGKAGHEAVIDGLKRWGADRGRILREEHEERGVARNLVNFVVEHDLPIRFAWEVRHIEMEPKRVIIEINDSPHDDAWKDLGVGELTADWYETSYPAMIDAYLPGAQAKWASLRGRGDTTNLLELTVHD